MRSARPGLAASKGWCHMHSIDSLTPLVAIDVSKNSSHAQLFLERGKPLGKTFVFAHDRAGLKSLAEALEELEKKSKRRPKVAFEATGVYSHPLERFLRSEGYTPIVLSPSRTSSVGKVLTKEGTKNDSVDCRTIAETVYMLPTPLEVSPELQASRRLIKDCVGVTAELRRAKCRMSRLLDEVFATAVSELGKAVYNLGFLQLFAAYPHPEKVVRHTARSLAKLMCKGTCHDADFYLKDAEAFRDACAEAYSGVNPDDGHTIALAAEARDLIELSARAKCFHDSVVETARESYSELSEQLAQIPCLGGYIGAALICFCGNMLKDLPTRKLVSFVGLAPRVSQSGERTGQGLGITRRGDSYMRSLLYLAARAAVSQKAPGIVDYFNRKLFGTKESGAHPRRSAVIATAVKMLGVVHALASDSGAKYDPKRVTGIISHK